MVTSTSPSPPEDPAELADRLRMVIARTARRLRQQEASGLTPSQTAALASVARAGSLSPSELADAERIRRPTATRIVARLEERGLLSRTPDPADGRRHRVALTPAGRALLESTRRRRTAYLARALRGRSAQEREVLSQAVELLEGLLEQER